MSGAFVDDVAGRTNDLVQVGRFGISGKAVAMAYDPVQSLLAISTDAGTIHVFGQQQVEVILTARTAIKHMRFVKGVYLVCLDAKSTIYVFSIYSNQQLSAFSPPGVVTAFETDPSLDWLVLGLQNGSIVAYDIDRGNLTRFKLDNLQKRVLPKEKLSQVVSIQFNPRDIGTLLVAYDKCALVYSLTSDEIKTSMVYEIPPYAPGGDGKMGSATRYPKLLQATYHPNSLNVLTAHEDGSLVFWDALTGELLQARSLFDTYVNLTQKGGGSAQQGPTNEKFLKVKWVCHADPDDTSLIIAGGDTPEGQGIHNLSVLHFGVAPKYSLTSYEKMGKYYAEPKQLRFLPIQNTSSLIDFLPFATRSPFFDGGHDPRFLLALLDTGEVENLRLPSGTLNYKSTLLPQSLLWIHPRTTVSDTFAVPKQQWLGMVARPSKHENLLQGGIPKKTNLKVNAMRSALGTGHVNGSVRLFDSSYSELPESTVLEANVSQTLNTISGVAVEKISFAGDNAELAVATEGGDVVLYKFGVNKRFDPNMRTLEVNMNALSIGRERKLMVDLRDRTPNFKDGFLPICAIHGQRGRISALKNSGIGFVAIAYECGDLIIVDRRGPAVIYEDNITRKHTAESGRITSLEFSIMTYGDDGYSSILLFGGTDAGECLTFKILPESSGRFSAQLVDVVRTNQGEILDIVPFKQQTGTPAIATFDVFHQLADGLLIAGEVLLVSTQDLRIFIPGKAKLSQKLFNQPVMAASLSIVAIKGSTAKPYASCVPTLLANGVIKVLSLPELREIKSLELPFNVDARFGRYSSVLPSGDVLVRISGSQACLVNICGTGQSFAQQPKDQLVTQRRIPYRPQIGTAQWMKGVKPMTYDELDILIGGEYRSRPKTKESEIANGQVTLEAVSGKSGNSSEDDFAYTKPVRGRTNGGYDPTRSVFRTVQNGYNTVEESINDYATKANQSMNETINDAKKDLVKGLVRSKFGI